MAEADWTFLTDSLSTGSVARGVTAGETPPNGGGSFVFAFATLDASTGLVGLYTNQVNFAPMAKGCSITGCLQRAPSGGPTGFAPLLFAAAQGNASTFNAYILGLSDADPHRIELRKGTLSLGVPDSPITMPPTNGVLQKSTATYPNATWLQLRLDVIANTNGDVVLQAFQNDLTANPCTAPIWTAISGMPELIDDALGINTGTVPLVGGYAGFAMQTSNVTRRSYVDQLTIERQL